MVPLSVIFAYSMVVIMLVIFGYCFELPRKFCKHCHRYGEPNPFSWKVFLKSCRGIEKDFFHACFICDKEICRDCVIKGYCDCEYCNQYAKYKYKFCKDCSKNHKIYNIKTIKKYY